MNKIRNILVISLMVLNIALVNTKAQDPVELARKREAEMNALKKKQQDGIKGLKNDFQKYQEERDKAFSEYLKKRWKEFQIFSGVKLTDIPKPIEPPAFKPPQFPADDKNIKLRTDPKVVPPVIKPGPPEPAITIPPENLPPSLPDNEIARVSFVFFGADIMIKSDKKMLAPYNAEISEKGFAGYWDIITSASYQNVINTLANYKINLKLNDWGYYLLIDSYSSKVHSNDPVSSQLLTWVILVKSGYKVKIGYSGDQLAIMIPVIQQLYNFEYINMGGINYYITKDLHASLFTYEQNYSNSDKPINMDSGEAVNFPENRKTRELNFKYGNETYNLAVAYNQNIVDYYNKYPNVDLVHYFNAPVSYLTMASLETQFKPILESHSPEEQANILLTFIHQAFPYKTDDDQFGKEKYFHVEDILSYPYSDCEDRSVLYSFLIKDLVKLQTIGLMSPGHVFTGVGFNSIMGDYVDFKDKPFTICDPTYIGATIGKGMPDVLQQKIIIISGN